jgi:hypothetical protein
MNTTGQMVCRISRHRWHDLFDESFQQELATLYWLSKRGHPPIAPAQLALAVRKSRSVCVHGDIHHVLHDLNSGLIRAVGITLASGTFASVTKEISTDLKQQGEQYVDWRLSVGMPFSTSWA